MKTKIAIVGSGNIGWALKQLLKKDFEINQGDIEDGFDALDISQVKDFLKGKTRNLSAMSPPYLQRNSLGSWWSLRGGPKASSGV